MSSTTGVLQFGQIRGNMENMEAGLESVVGYSGSCVGSINTECPRALFALQCAT